MIWNAGSSLISLFGLALTASFGINVKKILLMLQGVGYYARK
jgi:hypothetical protein